MATRYDYELKDRLITKYVKVSLSDVFSYTTTTSLEGVQIYITVGYNTFNKQRWVFIKDSLRDPACRSRARPVFPRAPGLSAAALISGGRTSRHCGSLRFQAMAALRDDISGSVSKARRDLGDTCLPGIGIFALPVTEQVVDHRRVHVGSSCDAAGTASAQGLQEEDLAAAEDVEVFRIGNFRAALPYGSSRRNCSP